MMNRKSPMEWRPHKAVVLILLFLAASTSNAHFTKNGSSIFSKYRFAQPFDGQVLRSRGFPFDSTMMTNRRLARHLQQDPDVICEAYQNFTESWDCSCKRYEVDGVRVNCSYIETQCNQDQSYCYDGFYDIVLNNQSQAEVVTTCINVVNVPEPEAVCVRVFPTSPGDFSTIASCSATYNDDVCNFCTACSPEEEAAAAASSTTPRNETNSTVSVTINCCNVQVDKVQTCGAVSAGGAIVPIFDVIADPNAQGKCKGKMSPSSSEMIFGTRAQRLFSLVPIAFTAWLLAW